jgi:hypothetical protein
VVSAKEAAQRSGRSGWEPDAHSKLGRSAAYRSTSTAKGDTPVWPPVPRANLTAGASRSFRRSRRRRWRDSRDCRPRLPPTHASGARKSLAFGLGHGHRRGKKMRVAARRITWRFRTSSEPKLLPAKGVSGDTWRVVGSAPAHENTSRVGARASRRSSPIRRPTEHRHSGGSARCTARDWRVTAVEVPCVPGATVR